MNTENNKKTEESSTDSLWGYSVSILVNHSIEKEWLHWMQEVHIQEMMESNCFIKAQFCKVHHQTPSHEASNYNIVFFAKDKQDIEKYYQDYAPLLRQKAWVLFRENVSYFRTELEYLSHH